MKNKSIVNVVLGIVYLGGFVWMIYSSERLWVKILFGLMGFFLLIGIINKLRGKTSEDEEE